MIPDEGKALDRRRIVRYRVLLKEENKNYLKCNTIEFFLSELQSALVQPFWSRRSVYSLPETNSRVKEIHAPRFEMSL